MFRVTRLGSRLTLIGVMLSVAVVMPSRAAEEKSAPPAPEAPPAPAPPAAAPVAPMVESIKIIFDDKAKNDGVLVFTFTPEGGAAKTISVTIADKEDRRDAARDAAKELTVALGDEYKVNKYDPDKIKITTKNKTKFSLTISSLTANGLSVRLL